ncbi:MAG: NAD(P)(+) transhydrogenase (Re/Si-specific) subunit beta [Myxococcota bacterium]
MMDALVIRNTVAPALYLLSTVMFITGLKRMTRVRSAASGNQMAAAAMLLAVVATLLELGLVDYRWIIGGAVVGAAIGAVAAVRVEMTSMPEMVALFNGFGGGASTLVALSVFWGQVVQPKSDLTPAQALLPVPATTVCLSIFIGAVTLTGSFIAFLKLQGKLRKGAPILFPGHHAMNAVLLVVTLGLSIWFAAFSTGTAAMVAALLLTGISLFLGVTLVLPIGGADMPVVVSLLNSYSGMAASAAGFVIGNPLLIVAGAMVGSAGLILTQIMCVAMNRSLMNVLLGGFGMEASSGGGGSSEYENVKSTSAEEAAMVLENAESVIVVPGYGLAVAQAQHTVRELANILEERGTTVRYAIHPVAGRMPGHMNVLLAEADVPYDQLVEMEAINSDFKNTDVAIIVGANDVVNPAALDEKDSPIYGMPILNVHEARTVFVIKRSLSPGYAGIKNKLFERDNTMMIFGDAKGVLQGLVTESKELSKAA